MTVNEGACWLVQGTPNLEWFGSWNDRAVALLIRSSEVSAFRVPHASGAVGLDCGGLFTG
jgi:hypothetical protein